MQLLLARHGNTFAPDDKVVWAGCKQDLPLVEKGRRQAMELARCFKEFNFRPSAVYCSPLKRTQEFARIIIAELELSLEAVVDSRLNELDYGSWGGRSDQEIIDLFGKENLEAWVKDSRWPKDCGWKQNPSIIASEVNSFLNDLLLRHQHENTVLAVSSNGRLRYFLQAIPGEFDKRVKSNSFKVGTGKYCSLEYTEKNWRLLDWNIPLTI